MSTKIKGIAIFRVAATQHFIDVFKNGITNSDPGGSDRMKMVTENLLQNIHTLIIQHDQKQRAPQD